MQLATVMVHVDGEPPAEGRMAIARELAERCGAGVIGIAACARRAGTATPGAFGVAMAFLERESREEEVHLHDSEAAFRAAMAGFGGDVAWRAAAAEPADYVAGEARAADLVILGASRQGLAPSLHAVDPAEVLLRAGRPVLVIPPERSSLQAERIVVAWKDAREARRAVADALPLLRLAKEVTVAEVAEAGDAGLGPEGMAGLTAWLARHGVAAEAVAAKAEGAVAATLDALARARSAELIVAGAYGRGRLREWVLGGVTRDLLAQSPHALFLSH